jgi:two-component system cell cycle sensor histidine kinase/response regulator CckA
MTEKGKDGESIQFHPESMESLGQFAGHLAHDLNNFMTPVMACGQMLKDGLDADHPLYFCGEQIVQAGEQCLELSRKLQAMGSRRRGVERVDLNEVVEPAFQALASELTERVTLTTSLADEPVPIQGDREQFQAMVTELLQNAAYAMKDAGGIIVVRSRVLGEHAVLEMQDEGPGMPPEVLENIFVPYFTTHRGSHARGLGLTMVYGLVRRYGGEVVCESAPDAGTLFRIRLPVCEVS